MSPGRLGGRAPKSGRPTPGPPPRSSCADFKKKRVARGFTKAQRDELARLAESNAETPMSAETRLRFDYDLAEAAIDWRGDWILSPRERNERLRKIADSARILDIELASIRFDDEALLALNKCRSRESRIEISIDWIEELRDRLDALRLQSDRAAHHISRVHPGRPADGDQVADTIRWLASAWEQAGVEAKVTPQPGRNERANHTRGGPFVDFLRTALQFLGDTSPRSALGDTARRALAVRGKAHPGK
jgi:hypothetical protein